jgi:hypothetical protein
MAAPPPQPQPQPQQQAQPPPQPQQQPQQPPPVRPRVHPWWIQAGLRLAGQHHPIGPLGQPAPAPAVPAPPAPAFPVPHAPAPPAGQQAPIGPLGQPAPAPAVPAPPAPAVPVPRAPAPPAGQQPPQPQPQQQPSAYQRFKDQIKNRTMNDSGRKSVLTELFDEQKKFARSNVLGKFSSQLCKQKGTPEDQCANALLNFETGLYVGSNIFSTNIE